MSNENNSSLPAMQAMSKKEPQLQMKSSQNKPSVAANGGTNNGHQVNSEIPKISITTFNVLAPMYFACTGEAKNIAHKEELIIEKYIERHQCIAELILSFNSDVVCLQEVWLPSESNLKNKKGIIDIFEDKLGARYNWIFHQRSGNREDGLMILYKKDKYEFIDDRKLNFGMMFRKKNRIGLIAHLQTKDEEKFNFVIATTHLLFPGQVTDRSGHNSHIKHLREQINDFVVQQRIDNDNVVFITGDFNAALSKLKTKGNSAFVDRMILNMMGKHWLVQLEDDGYEISQDPVPEDQELCSHMPHTDTPIDCDFIFYRSSLRDRQMRALQRRHVGNRPHAPSAFSLETSALESQDESEFSLFEESDGFYPQKPPPSITVAKPGSKRQMKKSPTMMGEMSLAQADFDQTDAKLSRRGNNSFATLSIRGRIKKALSFSDKRSSTEKQRSMTFKKQMDTSKYDEEKESSLEFDLLQTSFQTSSRAPKQRSKKTGIAPPVSNKKSEMRKLSSDEDPFASLSAMERVLVDYDEEKQCLVEFDLLGSKKLLPKKSPSLLKLGDMAMPKINSMRANKRERRPKKQQISAKMSLISIMSGRSQSKRRNRTVRKSPGLVVEDCYLEPKHFRGTLLIKRPKTEPINKQVFEILLSEAKKENRARRMQELQSQNVKQQGVEERSGSRVWKSKRAPTKGKKSKRPAIVEVTKVEEDFVEEWSKISDHRPKTAIFSIKL